MKGDGLYVMLWKWHSYVLSIYNNVCARVSKPVT